MTKIIGQNHRRVTPSYVTSLLLRKLILYYIQASNYGLTWPAGQAEYRMAWSGQAKISKIQPGLVDGLVACQAAGQAGSSESRMLKTAKYIENRLFDGLFVNKRKCLQKIWKKMVAIWSWYFHPAFERRFSGFPFSRSLRHKITTFDAYVEKERKKN